MAQLNYWSVDGREGDENRAELLSLRVETLINIRQRPDPEASGNTSFLAVHSTMCSLILDSRESGERFLRVDVRKDLEPDLVLRAAHGRHGVY